MYINKYLTSGTSTESANPCACTKSLIFEARAGLLQSSAIEGPRDLLPKLENFVLRIKEYY